MTKKLYTLNIGNYAPDITALTFPLFKQYCHKIGAEFCEITERKFPDWPLAYEKLQIYDLGKNNDWSIYIDADALLSPDLFDITEFLPTSTILHWGIDPANNRWVFDNYFRRDGRNISSAGWFTVASKWCRDIWAPCDLSPEEALARIFPSHRELNMGLEPKHFIDEFVTSRNIAKFGLKVTTIPQLQDKHGILGGYFWHVYGVPNHVKILQMREHLERMATNQLKCPPQGPIPTSH